MALEGEEDIHPYRNQGQDKDEQVVEIFLGFDDGGEHIGDEGSIFAGDLTLALNFFQVIW